MGMYPIKDMFPGVAEFLEMIAKHSPYTDPNIPLIRAIQVDTNASHLPMNVSSIEKDYPCSNFSTTCVSHAKPNSTDTTQYADKSFCERDVGLLYRVSDVPAAAVCVLQPSAVLPPETATTHLGDVDQGLPAVQLHDSRDAVRVHLWNAAERLQSNSLDVQRRARGWTCGLNISSSMSSRLWQSCRNAIMGMYPIKDMFPGVAEFLEMIAKHSPYTDPNIPLIRAIQVDTNTSHFPMNVSSIEDKYNCSLQ